MENPIPEVTAFRENVRILCERFYPSTIRHMPKRLNMQSQRTFPRLNMQSQRTFIRRAATDRPRPECLTNSGGKVVLHYAALIAERVSSQNLIPRPKVFQQGGKGTGVQEMQPKTLKNFSAQLPLFVLQSARRRIQCQRVGKNAVRIAHPTPSRNAALLSCKRDLHLQTMWSNRTMFISCIYRFYGTRT